MTDGPEPARTSARKTTPPKGDAGARQKRTASAKGAAGQRVPPGSDPPPRPKPSPPLWRTFFDNVERQLAPQLESLARSAEFASFVAMTTRLESKVRRQAEDRLRQYWHFWNLPAYSDVHQYAERLAALERQIRDLAERPDSQDGEAERPDATPDEP